MHECTGKITRETGFVFILSVSDVEYLKYFWTKECFNDFVLDRIS